MPGRETPVPVPATFMVCVGGNDVWWRCEAPAQAIGAKVCVIPEDDMEDNLVGTNGQAFRWQLYRDRDNPDHYEARYPDHEGPAAVWIRPDPVRSVHAAEMRSQGVLQVGEVDDNYMSDPKLNIFTRSQGFSSEGQLAHLKSLASMDRVVFSTELLRDIYLGHFSRENLPCPEPFVCMNNVAYEHWPEVVPHKGPPRVGWMGSPSHLWDLNLAWNALLHAARLGCETVLIGFDPMLPEGAPIPDSQRSQASAEMIRQWGRVGYRHIPWVAPSEYHRAALPLDIGLVPLLTNPHTVAKSDCKWLEYSISGAATIAQNNEVYNRTIVHGETGLLVNDEREMLYAVDILVNDEALRLKLVNNARRYIYEKRGLKQLRDEWTAALSP